MGRKSNYSVIEKKEKKEKNFEEIKEKIGKESISIEEMSIYLNERAKSRNPDLTNGCTVKTLKNYIQSLCKECGGLITVNDFKENPCDEKSKYTFPPRIHGFLLVLFDSNYFDGRKNDRKLLTRSQLNESLIKNIEYYLNEEDKKTITIHPAYVNAKIESDLSQEFNAILSSFIRNLYHSDKNIRHELFKYAIKEISRLESVITSNNSMELASKIVDGCKNNFEQDGELQSAIFRADSIEEYIIKFIAYLIVHNHEDSDTISCEALEKIKQLHCEKLTESKITQQVDDLSEERDELSDSDVEQKDYDNIANKYIESIIAADMWDILSKFNTYES